MLSYEEQRLQNIRENEELLKSLGLAPPRKAPAPPPKPKAVKKKKNTDDDEYSASPEPEREVRRSGRERKPVQPNRSLRQDDSDDDFLPVPNRYKPQRLDDKCKSSKRLIDEPQRIQQRLGERLHDPRTFGSIPGIEVGAWWPMRMDCSTAAIHAPVVAGISGTAESGAYSVALSGGYPDDVDLGEAFTYTGSGGRDLKGTKAKPKNLRTAPQTFDQSFHNPFNAALKKSAETRKPVRVIRGFKLDSKHAPATGYRYDGLYVVEKAWMAKGLTKGLMVCKYAFKRLPGQPPLPVRGDDDDERDDAQSEEEADEDKKVQDEEVGQGDRMQEEEKGNEAVGDGDRDSRKRKRQEDQDDRKGKYGQDEEDVDDEEEEEGEDGVEAAEPTVKRGRGRPRRCPLPASPPKRGPGRPRKNPVRSAVAEPGGRSRRYPLPEASLPEDGEAAAPVVKRRRGRPRNSVPEDPAAPTEECEAQASVPKRGRGVPRKNPAPETTVAEEPVKVDELKEETAAAPAQVVKRGRGRPRKQPFPGAPAEEPKEVEEAEPSLVKRGRGRPRKSGASDVPAAEREEARAASAKRRRGAPRESIPALPAEHAEAEAPVAKRGRGRPSGVSDAPAPSELEAMELVPGKRRRGRPRKSAASAAPGAAEPEGHERPSVKGGPGRPRTNTITKPRPSLPRRVSGRLSGTATPRSEAEDAEVDDLLTPTEPRRSTRRVAAPETPSGSPSVSHKCKRIGTPGTPGTQDTAPLQSTRMTRRLNVSPLTPGSARRRRVLEVVIPTPSPVKGP